MIKKIKILIIYIIFTTILLLRYENKEDKIFSYKIQNLKNKIKKCNFNKQIEKIEISNFINAAKLAKPAVVYVKSIYNSKKIKIPKQNNPLDDIFKDFFGNNNFKNHPSNKKYKNSLKYASGSGVIISKDGYIVTNNHVISNANQIEITLNNNRKYKAKLIGVDTSTDLALLKINVKNLPYLKFGNSDKLEVGEWVLAVGNPFKLNSTVTTGIVSAKARNIKIISDKMSIEAFIQTDAAVNTGNSGGALVNLKGELVGINTAIATSTGTFSGYSFAIPSSIVQKITNDLQKYGIVQRVVLGISIVDVNADLAEDKKLNIFNGVYIIDVKENGAAYLAGLKKGDIIIAINKNNVKNTSQLQEKIARCKPGDKILLTFYRKGVRKNITIVFENLVYKKKIKK